MFSFFKKKVEKEKPVQHKNEVPAGNAAALKTLERDLAKAEEHFKAGLVAEVQDLLKRGFSPNSNALGAHGYRRVVEYLQGQRDLPSAVEQTRLDVRHYAKRQLTWFRHEADVEWFNGFGEENAVLQSVLEAIAAGPRFK